MRRQHLLGVQVNYVRPYKGGTISNHKLPGHAFFQLPASIMIDTGKFVRFLQRLCGVPIPVSLIELLGEFLCFVLIPREKFGNVVLGIRPV